MPYGENRESGKFEETICKKLGVKHALFVNSGTPALICALAGLNVGIGDEVIVQAYIFIATASACMAVGAVPVICDIDNSLSLDPEDVERKITPYTKAIIVTHMQGVPGRLAQLREIAKKHNIYLIEDCCQAIGSKYFGEYTGVGSDAAAWSLNYFKNITCGEGGVCITNSDSTFVGAFFQSDPASNMWKTHIDEADNHVPVFSKTCFRASEISAAIANVQLSKLDGMLEKTRLLKKTLLEGLNAPINYEKQHVDDPEGDCGISFAMILKDKSLVTPFRDALAKEGLETWGEAYSASFPDRHVYCYWDAIMNKNEGSPQNYPWNNSMYKGSVQYDPNQCLKTLDILSRSLRIGINLNMSEQNMKEIADAINKADKSLG